MANTTIDLSFLSENKSFALTVAQLQAMDKELADIATRSPALLELSRAFGLTYDNAAKLTKELGLAPRELRQAVSTMQQLRGAGADAVTQYAVFAKQLGLTTDQMKLLSETVEELGGKEDVVNGLTQAFASLFILDKVNEFKGSIIETGKVLETLQARLKTTLGTQASADDALSRIQEFAATTPFEMVEVTDAFVKLKQRGIDPTNKALKQLGDLAASQGKSLDQTTEALLDASQGEFERLKEFGIKASAAGDKVNLSFQGVNKQFARTPEGIAEGVLALGALEGVAGGMEERAKTLGGAQSNLTDATTKLAGAAFELVQGPAVALIQSATKLIDTFFGLDKNLQKVILTTGVLGGVTVSAIAAVNAFRAAQIGAALASGIRTAAEIPGAIATAASTVKNVLATISEISLGEAKKAVAAAAVGSTAAISVETGAKAANTAATTANTAATTAGGAASKAGAASSIASATAFGIVAATALTAAAAIALVADAYLESTEGERAADDASKSLSKSLLAVEEGYKKRKTTLEANAKAEAAGASQAKKDALTFKELAEANRAKDAEIQAEYKKQADEKLSLLSKIFDKVREFLNIPNEALSRVFELTAKLPYPTAVTDWLKGAAEQIRQFQLKSAADSAKDSDILGFNKLSESATKLGDKLKETKQRSEGGVLGNASKQEIEGLVNGYEDLIKNVDKVVAKDAEQQTRKDETIRQLKAEQAEVEQANKLIKEKEKRITAVGNAETQWAAEIKTVTTNIGKQIATSEEANKAIEITKKQLEAGFITSDEAETVFQQVAKYAQATGDVQIAASKEVDSVRAKQFDTQKAFIENSIQLTELQGIREVKTAEETAAAVAGLRRQQAELDVQEQEAKIETLAASGRRNSVEGIAAEKALAKAKLDVQTATAQQEVANRNEASAKINKALDDSAKARAAAESKGAIESKTRVLAAIKGGNLSIEEAEKAADKESLARQQASTAAEIALKQAKQKELAAVGGKAAKEAAEKLGQEILQLQEKQVDLEITAVKKAQKEKLDAIKEISDRRKGEAGLASANADEAIAAQELALYKNKSKDRAEIDRQAGTLRLKAAEQQLRVQLDINQAEIESTRQGIAEGIISKKDGDKTILQLETDLAGKRSALIKNNLDQFKAAEDEKRQVIEDTLRRQSESLQAKTGSAEAKGNAEIAKLRLANAKVVGEALEKVEEQIAEKRLSLARKSAESAVSIAKLEQKAVSEKIAAGIISQKDAATERLKSATAVSAAQTSLINAQADEEVEAVRRVEKARQEAEQTALQGKLRAFEAVKQSLQKEQELRSQSNALLAAQDGLEAARANARQQVVNLRKQDIDLAKQAAEAAGNTKLAEELGLKSKQFELAIAKAQAGEIQRQYDIKLRNLELDIESKKIASEQLVLEKQMAILEAESALSTAKATGKSAEEVAAIQQKLGFSKQALELAERSAANADRVAAVQKQTLALERGSALQANQGQVNQLQGQAQIEAVKTGKASVATLNGIIGQANQAYAAGVPAAAVAIPAPDYEAVDAANDLLSKSLTGLSEGAEQVGVKLAGLSEVLSKMNLPAAPRLAGRRAKGGDVNAGGAYLVGEEGPEVVTFDKPGYVHTALETSRMLEAIASVGSGQPAADASQISNAEVIKQLEALNRKVDERQDVSPVEVPVNVTTQTVDGVAMALSVVRADRAARYSRKGF